MRTTNQLLNPSAEGSTASVISETLTTVTMVADTATGAGARSYRLAHSGVARAGAVVRVAERPVAASGQRWWARARARLDSSLTGARRMTGKLVFRNSSGAIIAHAQTQVGGNGAAVHRWLGAPYASPSERTELGVARVNLCPNPAAVPLTGWTGRGFGAGGAGTQALAFGSGLADGPDSFTRKVWTTAPSANATSGINAPLSAVDAGSTVTLSGWVRASSAGKVALMRAVWRDSGGAAGSLPTPPDGPTVPLAAGQWTRISTTLTVPAGAAGVIPLLDQAVGTPWAVNDTLDATGVLVEVGTTVGTYLDGSFGTTGTSLTDQATLTLSGAQVIEFVVVGDAPAGTATADLMIYRDQTGTATASDIEFVDQLMLGPLDGAVAPTYGDGSTTGWFWTGTANASTSYRPDTVPALTPYIDAAPAPRVQISFVEFVPNTATATVHRITDTEDKIVPGADNVAALGGLVRTDFYAPFGTPVRYVAEMFDAAGQSLGFSQAGTVTLVVNDAWISSPLNPAKSVRVEMDAEAGAMLRNPVDAVVHNIGGRRIVIAEATYGLDDLPMPFWVTTVADQRLAQAVFADADGVVVYRVPPPMEIPRVLYAFGIPGRSETNLPGGVEDFLFDLSVTEVSPPTTQVIVAQLAYRRFTRYYATYAAFRNAYGTYRAAQLTPPPEV